MKSQKTDWWRMRAARIDKVNIVKLKKKMKAKSEAEAVRRAVEMALQTTMPMTEPQQGREGVQHAQA